MKRTTTMVTMILTMLFASHAFGAIRAFNSSGVDLGVVSDVKCSTGFTCSIVSGKLNMVTAPIDTSGALTFVNDDVLSNAVDDVLSFASNDEISTIRALGFEAKAAVISLWADEGDDAGDKWNFSAADGSTLSILSNATVLATVSSVGDWSFKGTTPYLAIGDGGEEDAGVAFDGNAQDFHISLDDSSDDLVIGLGVAAGTTDAIRIDENQDVTFVQNVLGLGTDSLSGFLQKQVASTTTSITAAQCGSTFVSNSADVLTLPEASTVLGCRLTFVCGTADDFDVNPADGTDVIGITGALTPSAGDAIRCTDMGAGFVLEAVGANLWAVLHTNGTITDVN